MSTTNEKGKAIAIEKKTSAKEPTKIGTEKKQSISEILEHQLKEIQRKKTLADNRSIFIQKKAQLCEYLKQLQVQQEDQVFNSEDFSLTFKAGVSQYSQRPEFSISNPEMLFKFLVFLIANIDEAVKKIEKELLIDLDN